MSDLQFFFRKLGLPVSSSRIFLCVCASLCMPRRIVSSCVPFSGFERAIVLVGEPHGESKLRTNPERSLLSATVSRCDFSEAAMTFSMQSSTSVFFVLPCRAEQCVLFLFFWIAVLAVSRL